MRKVVVQHKKSPRIMEKDEKMPKNKLEKIAKNTQQEENQGAGIKSLILAALLVGVMAALAGWFLGKKISEEASTSSISNQAQAEKTANGDKKSHYEANNALVPLTPIITNLGEAEKARLQMEITLIVKENSTLTLEQQSEISNDFIALLRQMSIKQIKGPTGLMNLREDLLERARIRSEGKVSALLISSLVIE